MALEIRNIIKSYNGQIAVNNVSLTIQDGEFFSLLGPSGCGKTTLLRILSGFETPDSGQIILNGQDITNLSPQERPFNMVFQSYALFPHLTVAENLSYGLKIKNIEPKAIGEKILGALRMINMEGYAHRKPDTLSGGQCQRIAVARAFINQPKVLLLDEPLSALDKKMREHMQTELRVLQKDLNITFVFVTHDQDEAMTMSDRIAVMEKGNLKQVSDPQSLYNSPMNSFTASFLGDMNLFQDDGVKIFVRPQRTSIYLDQPHTDDKILPGEVINKIFKGFFWDVHVRLDTNRVVKCLVDSKNEDFIEDLHTGRHVFVGYSQIHAHVFESDK